MTPEDFQAQNIAVIPVHWRRKEPEVRWEPYQKRLPTGTEFARWFRPGRRTNAAVVCGWRGLTVLDFDTMEGYREWKAWAITQAGKPRDVALASYAVRTARGIHVYTFVTDAPRKTKFKWGDIQGAGGYVLIPPSVHPSGALYTPANDFPILTVATLAEVIPDPPAPTVRAMPTPDVYAGAALWPATTAEEIKARIPVASLFPEAVKSGSHFMMTRCPWHDDRSPSLRIDTTNGVVVCFSCGGKPMDVIATYAKLQGLDNKQAFRELRRML